MKSSESKAQEQQAEAVYKEMKDFLKQQSKNELIRIVFEQVGLYKELQSAAKKLLEDNKTLIAELETLKPKPAIETEKESV